MLRSIVRRKPLTSSTLRNSTAQRKPLPVGAAQYADRVVLQGTAKEPDALPVPNRGGRWKNSLKRALPYGLSALLGASMSIATGAAGPVMGVAASILSVLAGSALGTIPVALYGSSDHLILRMAESCRGGAVGFSGAVLALPAVRETLLSILPALVVPGFLGLGLVSMVALPSLIPDRRMESERN